MIGAFPQDEVRPVPGRAVRRIRAGFVNSGILGHRSVAHLLRTCADQMEDVEATHIDLGTGLSLFDRGVRRALGIPLSPATGALANLDLRRWRLELNVGLLAARRLTAAEREGPFDVLHFHTQAAAYASLGRMRRTPSVVSIDATQTLARLESASAIGQLSYGPNVAHDGLVFDAATAITATSEWAGRDLAAHYPACAGKVHVMPYPVRPIAEPRWIDERESRSGRPPRALFIGGDFQRKGGDDLLLAWEHGRFGDFAELVLVTDWPLAPDRLPKGVRLARGIAPYTAEWLALWHDADLFVMPTRHEAFGMVFQEAAAAGLPTIATRVNAVPEIVHDGRTGILVDPGDHAALAGALRELLESPGMRRHMGEEALAGISRMASVDRYTARLHEIISNAVFPDGRAHV